MTPGTLSFERWATRASTARLQRSLAPHCAMCWLPYPLKEHVQYALQISCKTNTGKAQIGEYRGSVTVQTGTDK